MCPGCAALPVTLTLGAVLRGQFVPSAPLPGGGIRGGAGRRSWPVPPLVLGAGAVVAGLALLGPDTLQTRLDVLGFGVCHQLLSHSFILGGHPLPVCARCTGIYLGTITTGGLLSVLRPRATGLPAPALLPVLALMFLTMVADGLNSTVQSLPGGHGLWETTNLLRLLTGTLAGIALMFLLYPIFNSVFWARERTSSESVLERPYELLGYGLVAALPVALILSASGDPGAGWAYWLGAILGIGGLLALLTVANILIVNTLTRREGTIGSWQAALSPLAIALLLTLAELLLLAYARGALTAALGAAAFPAGMPLAPGVR